MDYWLKQIHNVGATTLPCALTGATKICTVTIVTICITSFTQSKYTQNNKTAIVSLCITECCTQIHC